MQTLYEQDPEIARLFPDLHPPLAVQAAVVEANRCLNCFDAPCTAACPTHIDVPKFIQKIASGNLRGSANTILAANVLAGSCSRVCPVQVLCEGACVMHAQQMPPIEIAKLQRHAIDAFHAAGGSLKKWQGQERAGKVACIGAGPASLAAAAELRQRGFQVTVFDKRDLPGGLNTYGVAEYKLAARESLREIELIRELGVQFEFGAEVDAAGLRKLEKNFDLIFLGIGLGASHRLQLAGEGLPVLDALQFIEDYKLGRTTRIAGPVLVVGAGNTAIDAANAARRLGAEDVRILYRRGEEQISAFAFEYEHAKQEGVRFEWSTQPVAAHRAETGATALECVRTELGPDGTLRQVSESSFRLACNVVIAAIGQSPLVEFLAQCSGLEMAGGHVAVDRATGQTSNPKYFAGGDCINGGREVVDAVADGKRSGAAMASRLEEVRLG